MLPTESLIVSNFGHVGITPLAVLRLETGRLWLYREALGGAVGNFVGVEGAVLLHRLTEWLVLVQDLSVQSCVFCPFLVLFALVRVLLISNTI